MCMLCVETLKGKITPKEIARAFAEFDVPQEHMDEFSDMLREMGIIDDFVEAIWELEIEKMND